jgi:predicted permease
MSEIFSIFFNVILPVFGIVMLGFLIGGRLQLQAVTLTRTAYFVFVPAFIFQAISSAEIQLDVALQMVCFIVLAHLLAVFIAGGIGRALGRSKEMIAAFVMIASFGNVGNYGLAMIQFHLGDRAIAPASIYFVAISICAFVICVGAAGWAHGGSKGALWGLLKTPALWALPPALLVSVGGVPVPLMLSRMIGLLADAMIPVMLFALGLQLLEQKRVSLATDVWLASGIRLLLVPAITYAVAIPFTLNQLETATGILQAGMPTAILVAIIAKENNIVPSFVTSVVVVSTLASLVSLTLLMVIL